MTSAVLYPAAKKAEDKVVSLVLVVLLAPFSVLAYGAMTLGMLRRRKDCAPDSTVSDASPAGASSTFSSCERCGVMCSSARGALRPTLACTGPRRRT